MTAKRNRIYEAMRKHGIPRKIAYKLTVCFVR